jgi:hypothetical protein
MKRSLDIAAVVLTSLLLIGFAVLSIRGFIDPQPASVRFGMPVSDTAGALFYRVYLSRNLVSPLRARFSCSGRSPGGQRDPAAVRHVLPVAERRDAAGSSPRYIRAYRDHRGAALAASGREQEPAKAGCLGVIFMAQGASLPLASRRFEG